MLKCYPYSMISISTGLRLASFPSVLLLEVIWEGFLFWCLPSLIKIYLYLAAIGYLFESLGCLRSWVKHDKWHSFVTDCPSILLSHTHVLS